MLSLQNICVRFSYKEVLKNVSINFESEKTYVLLGENGAGKSTLAHIICGDSKPDGGKIFLDNKEVSFKNPHQALEKGIACVHQRPLLSDAISIYENFLIGTSLSAKSIKSKLMDLLPKWLPDINPKTKVQELPLSQKFFVSLIGVLLKNPQTIILDEPTALLDENQKSLLFKNLEELKSKGKCIILITHNFSEALKYGDNIILLKSGLVIKEGSTKDFTVESIKKELFGTEQKGVNSSVESSESALIPNSTLIQAESIIKLENYENKLICDISKKRSSKIAFVPSDRTFRGSNPNLTILQLTTAYHTNLNQTELYALCNKILAKAEVNIKPEEKASSLSGGMLQRLILSRELELNPKIIYLCEPLQGLDSLACNRLYKILHTEGLKGTKIIIISVADFPKELCQEHLLLEAN